MKTFKIILAVGGLSLSIYSYAQDPEEQTIYKGQSTVYSEVLGIGGSLYSLHYDRVLQLYENAYLNASGGVGVNYSGGGKSISFPLSLNYTTGLNRNHFEFGIAATYLGTRVETDSENYKEKEIFAGFRVAYKYQASKKLFFRGSLSPMFQIAELEYKDYAPGDCGLLGCDTFSYLKPLAFLFGISLGYSF